MRVQETVAALEGGCNIIPVTDQDFQWPRPESLPSDMRNICYFNAIRSVTCHDEADDWFLCIDMHVILRWIHDYQEACVAKLEKFMSGEASPSPHSSSHSNKPRFGSAGLHGAPMFRVGSSSDCPSPPPSPKSAAVDGAEGSTQENDES